MRARRFLITAALATTAATGAVITAGPASAFDYTRYTDHYGYNGDYGKAWHHYNPGAGYYKLADLKVTFDGLAKAAHDQEFVYTITVKNQGNGTASHVGATAELQGGYTYLAHRVSQGDAATQNIDQGEMIKNDNARIVADFGTLAPGQSATLQIAGKAPAYGTGSLTQLVQTWTSSGERNAANNHASITTQVG